MMTYNIVLTCYILSTVVVLVTLIMGIYVRNAPRSIHFFYLMLAIFVNNIGFIIDITSTVSDSVNIVIMMQHCSGPFIAPFLLFFVCEYCGIKLKNHQYFLLLIVPALTCLLGLTYPLSNIYIQKAEFIAGAPIPHTDITGTPLFYVLMSYNIILPLSAIGILIYHFRRSDAVFRKQARVVIIATILPIMGIIFDTLNLGDMDFDYLPIVLSITCLLISYSMLQLGLYHIAPTAREHIIETMSDGFILVDMQGKFIDANSKSKRLLPQLATMKVGMKIDENQGLSWLSNGNERQQEFSISQPDGDHQYYRISETVIHHDNNPICRCFMIYDMTDTKQLLHEVRLLAERDMLTSLFNRGTFYQKGNLLFEKYQDGNHLFEKRISQNNDNSACLLMIDLDFFKQINDTYGHLRGDEVLKAVADLLSSRFRATDLVARYGGEEFCAFLPNISEEDTLDIARELLKRTEMLEFLANDNSVFHVTISVGMATYDAKRHFKLETLLADADAALYAAKKAGKNMIYLSKIVYDNENIGDMAICPVHVEG